MPAEKMRRLRELVKWRKGWGQEDLGVAVFRAMVEDEEFRQIVMARLPTSRTKAAFTRSCDNR
jgi:hypothetical protein